MTNPYQAPQSSVVSEHSVTYVGFWKRVVAAFVDALLLMAISLPILYTVYGKEYFLSEQVIHGGVDAFFSYVFPALVIILFWVYKAATPGKMVFNAKIVNATTMQPASTGQLIGRYFAYIPAYMVFGLGVFWVGWDARKQGWHDKLANTVVVQP